MKNKNLTEVVFILDRSGSMGPLADDTIGGYNGLLEKQQKEPGEAMVTTVLFDDRYEMLHDHADIKKIHPITPNEYYARGMTALLDAIGKTITAVSNRHRFAPDDQIPARTLVVIITDGYENASREYQVQRVKEMIEHQEKECGWEFLFLGANMDAVGCANDFGIAPSHAVTYEADQEGTQLNFEGINQVVSDTRAARPFTLGWKEEIESYRKRRNR